MPQSIGKHVLWHWNRAAALWYIKEVELLEEEFRWYILSCETMDNIWKQLGSPSTFADTTSAKDKSISAGSSVYALQRAHGYREMAKRARVSFESFDGTWPKEGQSLILYLRERRPSLEVDWVEAAKQRMEEARGHWAEGCKRVHQNGKSGWSGSIVWRGGCQWWRRGQGRVNTFSEWHSDLIRANSNIFFSACLAFSVSVIKNI